MGHVSCEVARRSWGTAWVNTVAPGPTQMVKCQNAACGHEIPAYSRFCVVCGRDAGFPNVRAAEAPDEVAALGDRLQVASDAATAAGGAEVFLQFIDAVNSSRVVICRSLSVLSQLVSSDSQLYGTFHRQVEAGTRIPEDNDWDRARESVESALFPQYYRHMTYGALSLNGLGQTAYGPFSIALAETAVADRTSAFDEPLFPFFRSRRIVVGTPVPLGHRATWARRGELAASKVGHRIGSATGKGAFSALLLEPGNNTEGDCVEAHVYGPIHRRAIAGVVGPLPKRREDRLLAQSAFRKLAEIGVSLSFT